MADSIAFPEQTSLPNHIAAVHGLFQVFFLFKNLEREKTKQCQQNVFNEELENHFPHRLEKYTTLGRLNKHYG